MNNKKGMMLWYLLAIILGVLLLVFILYFLYIGNKTSWQFIKDLPVGYNDSDRLLGLDDLSEEELRALNCNPIGEAYLDTERTSFTDFNTKYFYFKIGGKNTNLYLGEENFAIMLSINWGGDVKIGNIVNDVIIIEEDYLYEKQAGYKKYKDVLPSLEELRILHNSYQLQGGSVWCKDFDDFDDTNFNPEFSCDVLKGEVAFYDEVLKDDKNKGWRCICDSREKYGYYNENSGAWTNFEVPCVQYTKVLEDAGNLEYAYGNGLDWSKVKGTASENDVGVCVLYYSTRGLNDALIDKKNYIGYDTLKIDSVNDLKTYEVNFEGYIEKIYRVLNEDSGMTRKECISKAKRIVPRNYYGMFYESSVGNLIKGNGDDEGDCVRFSSEGINVIKETLRNDCYQIANSDSGADYSFFMIKKGSEKLIFSEDGEISVKYSLDYYAKERGDDLSEVDVKTKCSRWEEFDLSFVTGVMLNGEYRGDENSRRKGSCLLERRYLVNNNFVEDKNYLFENDDLVEIGNDKDICCYARIDED